MSQQQADLIRKTIRLLRSDMRALVRLAERPGVPLVSRDELKAEAKIREDRIGELSEVAKALEPSQNYKNWERGQAAAMANVKPSVLMPGSKPYL